MGTSVPVSSSDCNSYPCSQASVTGVNTTAPTVAGQDGDEGDEVEKCGHQCEDDLHHQELEGEFHLRTFRILSKLFDKKETYSDEISDLEEIEEGPEEGDEEAGDDHEEEPVVVTDAVGSTLEDDSSVWDTDTRGWGGARHANDAQYLELVKDKETPVKLETGILTRKSGINCNQSFLLS